MSEEGCLSAASADDVENDLQHDRDDLVGGQFNLDGAKR